MCSIHRPATAPSTPPPGLVSVTRQRSCQAVADRKEGIDGYLEGVPEAALEGQCRRYTPHPVILTRQSSSRPRRPVFAFDLAGRPEIGLPVLHPRDQLRVRGRPNDLVELDSIVRDEAHPLDEDVVRHPSIPAPKHA